MASIDDDQKIVCLLRLAIITFNIYIVGEEEAIHFLVPSWRGMLLPASQSH